MEFPIGVSDFEEMIQSNYHFIDKSLLIKEIMEDGGKAILLTRPRRFGKTLNLSMLYYFLSKSYHDKANKNLFEGLNISKEKEFCKKHQGQYPVIFISFKDIKELNFDAAYKKIIVLISALYGQHRYLLEGDLLAQDEKIIFEALLNQKAEKANVEAAIQVLAKYLRKKFNRLPIILIDEYDTPIQQAYLKKHYDEMIIFMRGFLGQALKDNIPEERFLEKAIVTGITRIGQESIFSGLNNFEVYSVLKEKYGQYFGFTEEEVLKLMNNSHQTVPLASIKEWYNGYQVGKYVLYNPWSIIKCFKENGALKWYWVNTASNDLIAQLLWDAKSTVKKQFEELLQGNNIEQAIFENLVFADIKKREGALWSLLLYAGYLKVLSTERRGNRLVAILAIPNREVSYVYDDIIEQWFDEAIDLDSYDDFKQSLINGDVEKFKKYISDYMIQTGSYFDFNSKTNEQIFHVFILGLIVGLRDYYSIHSNQEGGFGRCDVMFMPKDKRNNGILLEFKISKVPNDLMNKAQEALEQIKDRKYIEQFRQAGVSSVLVVGLAFCGKQLELVSENIVIEN
ncbi:hypothetical protein AYO37_00115 [Opitutia bacterium SCGC AG-212-L18]|nr:hypothetical protein AYO37_00115 [Opitutae bacterium SCGC AG-212-L18]